MPSRTEGGQVTEPKTAHERRSYIGTVFLGLACIVLIAMAWGFRDVRSTVDKLANGGTPSAQSRLIYQAQTRFLLCSRNDSLVTAGKHHDRDVACQGYESLASAYRTQGVLHPPKEP